MGPRSIELDKLVQDMTDYYRSESNRLLHALDTLDVSPGAVVAAQWPGDERWYRARVVEVVEDDYKGGDDADGATAAALLDVDFVDFGDCDKKPSRRKSALRSKTSERGFLSQSPKSTKSTSSRAAAVAPSASSPHL